MERDSEIADQFRGGEARDHGERATVEADWSLDDAESWAQVDEFLNHYARNRRNQWKLASAGFDDRDDFRQEAVRILLEKRQHGSLGAVRDVGAWCSVAIGNWLMDLRDERDKSSGVYLESVTASSGGEVEADPELGSSPGSTPNELQESSVESLYMSKEEWRHGRDRAILGFSMLTISDRTLLRIAYRQWPIAQDEIKHIADKQKVSMSEAISRVAELYRDQAKIEAAETETVEERLARKYHRIIALSRRRIARRARQREDEAPAKREQRIAKLRQQQRDLHRELEIAKRIPSKPLAEFFNCKPSAMDQRMKRAEKRLFELIVSIEQM